MPQTVTMLIQDDLIPHIVMSTATPNPLAPPRAPSLNPLDSIVLTNNLKSDVSVDIPWAQHVFQGGGGLRQFNINAGQSVTLTVLNNPKPTYRNKKHRYTIYVLDDGPYVIAASDPEMEVK